MEYLGRSSQELYIPPPANTADPVELAMPVVSQVINADFDPTLHERLIVEYLDDVADENGLFRTRYSLETQTAFTVPKIEPDATERMVPYAQHEDPFNTHIVGDFGGYSRLAIGEFFGLGAVRAFCLMFDRALIVSTCEELASTDLLHVPVMAVREISQKDD